MTRADFIRWLAQHYPDLDAGGIIEGCQAGGWPEPSRQAVESALAKSGTRGRPSSRDKCPTCGQRVDEPAIVLDARLPSPAVVRSFVDSMAVATMSQKPRTKRAWRTPKAPQSKRKAK